IPPHHVDDVPVVGLHQHDDVPVVPKPVLVDEDEDPKEDEFEEEEDPQEEEDDMESEPEDAIEVEKPIEHEDETVPASVHEVGESSTAHFLREDSDGLFPGLIRRDINFLFGRMASLSRQLYGRETAPALTRARAHEFYQEMIRRGFVFEERPNEAINVLIEDEKSPSPEIIPPKSAPLTQPAIRRMIKENVDVVIVAERAKQANVGNDASGSRLVRGQDVTPAICKKVNFAAATLQGPALTWWNAKIATMGLETVNQMPWTEMK
nr:hypothetical protein [Tanacetum cinerariifolium]